MYDAITAVHTVQAPNELGLLREARDLLVWYADTSVSPRLHQLQVARVGGCCLRIQVGLQGTCRHFQLAAGAFLVKGVDREFLFKLGRPFPDTRLGRQEIRGSSSRPSGGRNTCSGHDARHSQNERGETLLIPAHPASPGHASLKRKSRGQVRWSDKRVGDMPRSNMAARRSRTRSVLRTWITGGFFTVPAPERVLRGRSCASGSLASSS